MIDLADLAYGGAPYKEVEIAHKHVLDVISKNEAGFQPVLTRWPTFPTMLTNALTSRFGYRVQQITVSNSSAGDLTEEDSRLIARDYHTREEEEDGNSRDRHMASAVPTSAGKLCTRRDRKA